MGTQGPCLSEQEANWAREYAEIKGIPSSATQSPSQQVQWLVRLLHDRGQTAGRVLDIGCGNGRNALFLAQQGFAVWAFDVVDSVLSDLRERAQAADLADRLTVTCQSAAQRWSFGDAFFDAAIDICVFSNMLTEEMAAHYRAELDRVLRPGGSFLLYAILNEDSYYRPLVRPDGLLCDPKNGLWSRLLSQRQLEAHFEQTLKLVDSTPIEKSDCLINGQTCQRRTVRLLFQKPV